MTEQRDRSPVFTIRPHHFREIYPWLHRMAAYAAPLGIMETAFQDVAGAVRMAVVKGELSGEEISDVVGTTTEEGDHFEQNARKAFERYMQMPDNEPIDIVEGPDEICQGCAIGKHCKEERLDSIYMNAFISRLETMGIRVGVEQIRVGKEKRRKVSVTVGIVKRYINERFHIPNL